MVGFVMKFFTSAGEVYPEGTLRFLRVTDKACRVNLIDYVFWEGAFLWCSCCAVLFSHFHVWGQTLHSWKLSHSQVLCIVKAVPAWR